MKPKTNEKQHLAKLTRIKNKMTALDAKYPALDLKDSILRKDVEDYGQLMRASIYASVNAKYCGSDNPDSMCENCNCWKQARAASM